MNCLKVTNGRYIDGPTIRHLHLVYFFLRLFTIILGRFFLYVIMEIKKKKKKKKGKERKKRRVIVIVLIIKK